MSSGTTINIPILEISPRERDESKPTPESVDAGTRLLRETGLVVIESVLPRDWIEELNSVMQAVLDMGEDVHNGTHPMLKMPFMDARIVDNPFAMPIMKALMGDKIFAYLPYGCNSTTPGSQIHRCKGFRRYMDEHVRRCTRGVSFSGYTIR